MKYIVSGYIGYDNFGDEAIASILVDKLKKEGAEKITLISSNPLKTAKLYGVDSCGKFNFFKKLLMADVLVSGGGSLLQDVTSIKSLFYYLGIIYCALFLRKKVIIYSQGIGPIKSKFGQILTKLALSNCTDISVRDSKSKALMNKWNISSTLVKDPVLEIEFENKNIKDVVGIQLRSFGQISDTFLISLAKKISENFRDKTIKIFSLQDIIDLEICTKFKKLLEEYGCNDVSLHKNLSVNDVFNELSSLEYLIGMRFHSLVVGVKSGVKVLGINYDPKIENLAEEYKFPTIELSQTNFDEEFKQLLQ